jgi:hypothetical protein
MGPPVRAVVAAGVCSFGGSLTPAQIANAGTNCGASSLLRCAKPVPRSPVVTFDQTNEHTFYLFFGTCPRLPAFACLRVALIECCGGLASLPNTDAV